MIAASNDNRKLIYRSSNHVNRFGRYLAMPRSLKNSTLSLPVVHSLLEKRPAQSPISSRTPRKIRKKTTERAPQAKNAVALLNELRQGLVYTLESQSGPIHSPYFTMSVMVDGQKYSGHGRSKKIARIDAAVTALKSFIQFKDGGAILTTLQAQKNVDFTSDDHLDNELEKESGAFEDGKQVVIPDKGPVMLLYELFTDVKFECVSSDGMQHSRFKMIVLVNNNRYEGTGPSKKSAKTAAAKAALAGQCNISYSPIQAQSIIANSNSLTNATYPDDHPIELPQMFADAIGKMVVDKFNEIIVGNTMYARRKVLAGIVMTNGLDLTNAKVISVSTGTKCVNGEYISVSGSVVNDSHAEIVTRRCLIDFLYSQLEMHTNPDLGGQSIFLRTTNAEQMFTLRAGIDFHLYINTAPCGDARIFSPHEDDTNLGIDKHPNRKARGQLRTKIESGEGTIPVKNSDGIQTWDGVLQGQRLLTMSCSDKIAKWNVVGVQGALLASIVQPIYLRSIVLGSLLHPAHMYRAICGRIESAIQNLPPPYRLNKPKLALVTSAECRSQTKAPNFGVNWTIGMSDVEVINSLTGKLFNGKMSRITKQTLFNRFVNLIRNLPIPDKALIVADDYGETKSRVQSYQRAKTELFGAFRREDLGNWLKKPIEQDQFNLPG